MGLWAYVSVGGSCEGCCISFVVDEHILINEYKGILRSAGMQNGEFKEAQRLTDRWRKRCPRNPSKPPITD